MKKSLLAALGLAAACFSLPAAAQLDSSAVYAGASLGRSHFTDVCGKLPACRDRDTLWNAFAGLQFSRFLGLETGYRDFGHATIGDTAFKANAIEADVVANYPLRGRFGLIARVGAFNAKIKGAGAESKKTGVTFGWGAYFDVSRNTGFRFEWQRYAKASDKDKVGFETHLDSLSLAAVLRFR